ncbi:MAG: M48 family peptidase [Blastocatellia bacterium]|nr:M48 family peptidase [Blastocatellia bacterium]MBK6425262.1 M48 family peptidase [Blastocatellia bacterium]
MSRTTPPESSRDLDRLAVEAYRDVARLGHDDPGVPPIEVRYFAYAGLRSTVRLRDGRIYVRLSDLFEAAPDDIIGALVRILLAKLLRRRVRAEWNATYRLFAIRDDVVSASEAARRSRGRKRLADPAGRVFDLDEMFDRINAEFFAGAVERPRLGWTLRDAWRTHGHYDPAHGSVAISRSLDTPETPAYVVEFVLYHEMLHVAMPAEVRNGRHMHHTAKFRRAEAQHPRMTDAVAWLETFSRKNGTRRRRRRLTKRG